MTSRGERALQARIAAHTSWANTPDRTARTAKARAALLSKFERDVDPEGVLPSDERARRAEHARKAHFTRLALRSAQARRRHCRNPHKGSTAGGDPA
ncbi:hypothetical protein [Nocardia sp. alder85J]|uniref:hypothetical protein n=1 Tax=Nocardia sp. alder85J TaxID=2862949 RepID=UPI001CD305D1|nr:hypothetical protein [Nocardia sp. alder85J]MCX4094841.1 hypothetical protein [Nocardia sp. alder85J]